MREWRRERVEEREREKEQFHFRLNPEFFCFVSLTSSLKSVIPYIIHRIWADLVLLQWLIVGEKPNYSEIIPFDEAHDGADPVFCFSLFPLWSTFTSHQMKV